MPTVDHNTFAATALDPHAADAVPGSYGYLGRYRLDRMVGQGAMGAVFEAFDATLGRTVAIKTLHSVDTQDATVGMQASGDAAQDEDRFSDAAILQEARAAATLNHPHIVTVYDAGRATSSALGRDLPYVAMELLQGTDLRSYTVQGGCAQPMAVRDAVSLVGKLALALDHAHKNGVLHRDIKPANVFVAHGGSPKILDFGLAKFTARAVGRNAAPGATSSAMPLLGETAAQPQSELAAGSPLYMSPEQMRSMLPLQSPPHRPQDATPVDGRSDVYSLGVVLYELLCGKTPFSAPTLELLHERIAHSPADPPHLINAAVPRELSEMVLRALAKRPEDRYRSAGQFARELRRWGAQTAEPEAARSADSRGSPLSKPGTGVKTRPVWVWTGTAVVLCSLVVLTALLVRRGTAAKAPVDAKSPAANIVAAQQPPTQTDNKPASVSATSEPVPQNPPVAAAPSPAVAAAASVSIVPAAAPVLSAAPTANAAPAAVIATNTEGRIRLAVSPWGTIEVDGKVVGVSPPLTSLALPPGEHNITVRNADFAPRKFKILIEAGKTQRISHRFD